MVYWYSPVQLATLRLTSRRIRPKKEAAVTLPWYSLGFTSSELGRRQVVGGNGHCATSRYPERLHCC